MIPTYRSSRPDQWHEPRAHSDPSQRLHAYGKVQPMDDAPKPIDKVELAICAFMVIGTGVVLAIAGGLVAL